MRLAGPAHHIPGRRGLAVAMVLLAGAGLAAGAEQQADLAADLALTRFYQPDLRREGREAALLATQRVFADLGVKLIYSDAEVAAAVAGAAGRVQADPVADSRLLYEAVYHLSDLVRLPRAALAVVPRLVLVDGLRVLPEGSGRGRRLPIVRDDPSRTVFVDHANLNQFDFFGNFVHPKVNFAMLLEVGLEGRLRDLGPAALSELGLDVLVDDGEWRRLNDTATRSTGYTGEEIAFVGWKTAARVTPPGLLYDAVRQASSGVPTTSYPGMPEPTQPWWSPRHSPAADRQGILRSMFSRTPVFFERIEGSGGASQDQVLKEKTRLVLYGAFVGSGGALDRDYWIARHPDNAVVAELTRDFDGRLLAQLAERLARNPATRGLQLAPRP